MIVFGVTFLIAIVLLGIYGLRVRAARLKQAEHGIARLEDALRETGAAVGRVESEIAAVTDVVKASLTPREPTKPRPKAERPVFPRDPLLDEQARRVFPYYVTALAAACQPLASPLSEWKAGSKLVLPPRLPTKTAKGHRYFTFQPGQAPYYDAEWSPLTCPAPSR